MTNNCTDHRCSEECYNRWAKRQSTKTIQQLATLGPEFKILCGSLHMKKTRPYNGEQVRDHIRASFDRLVEGIRYWRKTQDVCFEFLAITHVTGTWIHWDLLAYAKWEGPEESLKTALSQITKKAGFSVLRLEGMYNMYAKVRYTYKTCDELPKLLNKGDKIRKVYGNIKTFHKPKT